MYEVVYEIRRFPLPTDSIVFLIFVIVTVGFTINYFVDAIEIVKAVGMLSHKSICRFIVGGLFAIVFLLCLADFVDSILYGGSDDYKFAQKYYNGEYNVVTGKVENFIAKHSDDEHEHLEEFTVKEIYFEYGHAYKVGFQNIGEVIYKNGQDVKIYYIPEYDGNDIMNVIVKIEEKVCD